MAAAKLREKKLFFTIVRHGQTEGNRLQLVQGRTDLPLNDAGKDQANNLGRKLSREIFNYVYTSDLTRAYDTAEAIVETNRQIQPKTGIIKKDARLREQDFGLWEGQKYSMLYEEAVKRNIRDFRYFEPDHGETPKMVLARAKEFFRDVAKDVMGHDGNEVSILIVSHGNLIHMLLASFQSDYACQMPAAFGVPEGKKIAPSASITKLEGTLAAYEDSKIKIENFVCTSLYDSDV